ncbi:MAG TPA: 3-deoxy-manno-octulosonate cytidylyltransferase [Terriglobia bacterium]|nr:3-deoxy-manno-octulosonate cytidylyltransferase [Terriglobia bacterium]
MHKILGVIPAHLESRRLPRKLLRPLCGHPMIWWVYHRARQARRLDTLMVATDSPEIFDFCHRAQIPVVMTSAEHQSGTDRVYEVVERGLMSAGPEDVYVNIQGDEPMITPRHIEQLLEPFAGPPGSEASGTQVSTLKVSINLEDALDPNNVKVVTDLAGRALYFSRAPIPHDRDGSGRTRYYKHLGLYAYTVRALAKFHALTPSRLELTEKLEQLRLLENGIPITVVETPEDSTGVDTEEDFRKVEQYFSELIRTGTALV